MTTAAAPGSRLSATTLVLHWGVGLAVIGLLAFGFWLQTVPSGPDKTPLVQVHKSFGILVFVLALGRVLWRWHEGFPAPAGPHGRWEMRGARASHLFLITATLLMPLSGILRSIAYARPVSVFGVPLIPKLFETKQEWLYTPAATLHDTLALLLAALILLHAGAALLHQIRDRDGTLARILGGRARGRVEQR